MVEDSSNDLLLRHGVCPEDTPFIRQAAKHGHRCADGLGMLVGQGEIAFELWTGTPPPYGVMKSRILAEYLGK